MRLLSITGLLFIIAFLTGCKQAPTEQSSFSFSPEKPLPGATITVHYNPEGSLLEGKDEIEMIAYLYGTDLHDAIGIKMEKEGDYLTAQFSSSDSTLGILIKFKSDENFDVNNNLGFVIHLYQNNKIIPGSLAGYAVAINTWGSYYMDLKRDAEKALDLFEEEFNSNPKMKNEFLDSYLSVKTRVYKESADSIVLAELSLIEKDLTKSELELSALTEWYGRVNNKDKEEYYTNVLLENYPSAKFIQMQRFREIADETDISEKIRLAEKFIKDFPGSDLSQNVYDAIANYYRDNKMFVELKNFLKENIQKVHPYRFYSAVNKMIQDNTNPDIALEIAKLGVSRNRNEINTPQQQKPNYYTNAEWLETRKYLLGLNLFAYANLLSRSGKKSEALTYAEEAVTLTNEKEIEIAELYAELLIANQNHDKALLFIEKQITEKGGSEKLKKLLKSAYVSDKGTEEGFEKVEAEVETAALRMMRSKLKKTMINEPAPDFTLKDLSGRDISMASLRGKIVILDFWATWCGPCLLSFPGMKKAVEKYQDDDNVSFLFINSWENAADKKQIAEDFIKQNNYPFQVLLDTENKVIEKYRVSGIPTKFVIDKNGSIRFRSVGFSGNTDQMVAELVEMISLAK